MPNPFSHNYAPNQAVNEYQAHLQAQKAADKAVTAPEGMVATYALTDRLPNWNLLLDIEKPHVYSTRALLEAVAVLESPDILTPSPRVTAQAARFHAVLATRF